MVWVSRRVDQGTTVRWPATDGGLRWRVPLHSQPASRKRDPRFYNGYVLLADRRVGAGQSSWCSLRHSNPREGRGVRNRHGRYRFPLRASFYSRIGDSFTQGGVAGLRGHSTLLFVSEMTHSNLATRLIKSWTQKHVGQCVTRDALYLRCRREQRDSAKLNRWNQRVSPIAVDSKGQ